MFISTVASLHSVDFKPLQTLLLFTTDGQVCVFAKKVPTYIPAFSNMIGSKTKKIH